MIFVDDVYCIDSYFLFWVEASVVGHSATSTRVGVL